MDDPFAQLLVVLAILTIVVIIIPSGIFDIWGVGRFRTFVVVGLLVALSVAVYYGTISLMEWVQTES